MEFSVHAQLERPACAGRAKPSGFRPCVKGDTGEQLGKRCGDSAGSNAAIAANGPAPDIIVDQGRDA